jgi:hypothetical protein
VQDEARTGVISESSVASPLSHGRFLHGTGKGCVTIGRKTGLAPPNDWEQHSEPFEKLVEVLPAYGGDRDIYISQNRFYGSRRGSRLAQLCALYADLDYYNVPDLANMDPLGVLDLAFEALTRARIPRPSIAMDTGRGLSLVWQHEPEPATALPRWNRCQQQIFEALKHLGADPSATDAARVMRLAGTYNSKSGTIVRSIWQDTQAIWTFGELADEVLPRTRQELADLRARRNEERAQRGPRKASEHQEGTRKGFTLRTLNQERLNDLRRLMRLRGQDTLPPGKRDHWMFVAAVSLGYLVKPEFLERELIKLGWEKANWDEAETLSRMQAVISRAQAASVAETTDSPQQQQRDPRYRLTNEKIISLLAITPEEQESMEVIKPKDTAKQRDKKRKEQERRSKGSVPREEYLADKSERRQHARPRARALRSEGLSYRKIGEQLGTSHMHVKRLLDEGV